MRIQKATPHLEMNNMENEKISNIDKHEVYWLISKMVYENCGSERKICLSENKQNIIDWYNNQLAEQPHKKSIGINGKIIECELHFKRGSVLEWFDKINDFDTKLKGNGIVMTLEIEKINEYIHNGALNLDFL